MSKLEKLRTVLGVEKLRVHELEKALREMRSEHAQIKLTADSKLEEAHALSTSIEGRSLEVDAKLGEVSRKMSEIIRKSSEIEAKESSLMRERMSFYNERDAHERSLSDQRDDLRKWERKLHKQKQLDLEEAQKRIDVANWDLKSKEDDISTRMENLVLKEKEAAVISNNLEVREKELLELEDKLNAREQKQLDLEEAQKRIDVANLELESKEDYIIMRMENLVLKEKEAAVISKNFEVREKELLELEEKLNAREQVDLLMKNYTLCELKAIAREREIPGYKNLRKLELAQILGIDLVADAKSKPKEQHEMMQTTTTTNWFDLPLNLQVNILGRVVAIEKLWNIPKVCRDWRKICKEPSMWRVIYMDSDQCSDCWPYPWPSGLPATDIIAQKMCKIAVDRSQGELVAITMVGFCDKELLNYVVDRSLKLRILEIAYPELGGESLSEALKKLPKLEELSIYCALGLQLDKEFGSHCPDLKTLKLDRCDSIGDKDIIAITKNLRGLRHLEIRMNSTLTNTGLQAMLDGCPCLKVLDLRLCYGVDLKGVSGKRLEQIGCVLHAEPVDTEPYDLCCESLMDLRTWRKILDGDFMARMSDSDSD